MQLIYSMNLRLLIWLGKGGHNLLRATINCVFLPFVIRTRIISVVFVFILTSKLYALEVPGYFHAYCEKGIHKTVPHGNRWNKLFHSLLFELDDPEKCQTFFEMVSSSSEISITDKMELFKIQGLIASIRSLKSHILYYRQKISIIKRRYHIKNISCEDNVDV